MASSAHPTRRVTPLDLSRTTLFTSIFAVLQPDSSEDHQPFGVSKRDGIYTITCVARVHHALASCSAQAARVCKQRAAHSLVQARHIRFLRHRQDRLAPLRDIRSVDALLADPLLPRLMTARFTKGRCVTPFLLGWCVQLSDLCSTKSAEAQERERVTHIKPERLI